MEDVRKTGPVGLKGINAQTGEETEILEYVPAIKLGRTPDSYGIGLDLSFQSNTGDLGSSKFDEDILTMEQIEDVETMRAEKQSILGKWVNGISKGAVLAGTAFLEGAVGLLVGSVDIIGNIGKEHLPCNACVIHKQINLSEILFREADEIFNVVFI